MNAFQLGTKSVFRKPMKSILLLLVIIVISSFLMAGLTTRSANIQTQEKTRQAVGATFRLEVNEKDREKRLDEATKVIGDKEGEYGGVQQKKIGDAWGVSTDNSFETVLYGDVEKIIEVEGIEDYNLITALELANPVNFKRIEEKDVDQGWDVGGINLRGNRMMELDMDVASGKIEIIDGRGIEAKDKDVCVISEELAELNNLKVGDILEFNNIKEKEASEVYSAKIIGIYTGARNIEPIMSGDSFRSENMIFTDLHFPEKPSGNEGDPLYQYAIFKVADVTKYDEIKEEVLQTKIGWERYDLLDNNGNSENMAQNFNDLEKVSGLLLIVVCIASFLILFFIFIFWMKNRTQEIGIFMSLGIPKRKIWFQFLYEVLLIGIVGFILSFSISPIISNGTATYLVKQQEELVQEEKESTELQVATEYRESEKEITGVEVKITTEMVVLSGSGILLLLVISVSVAGISIMRKKPKQILSEMS